MAVKVIRSSDAGAPALSGQAGSLLGVLDYALTNSTAGLGWSIAFTGTNKRAYRGGSGLRHYLRVVDDGASDGMTSAQEGRIRGFESMTDVDTGTAPFPTPAQLANGLPVRKSATTDATARPWIIVGDDRTFYVMVLTGDVSGKYFTWMFGEIFSVKANDLGRTAIVGRSGENSGLEGGERLPTVIPLGSGGTGSGAHFLARRSNGEASVAFGKQGYDAASGFLGDFDGLVAFPNPADGKILTAKVGVGTISPADRRGWMRGYYHFLHPRTSVADGDTFVQDGRTYLLVRNVGLGGAADHVFCFDITGPWDTNP